MHAHDIIQAAKDGDTLRLEQLIATNPPLVNARAESGETPLMAALYRGHHAIVDSLVAAGATLDVFAAAALGEMAALEAALAADPAAVNAFAFDGWTPLHLAAFFGRKPAAARLLAAGAGLST